MITYQDPPSSLGGSFIQLRAKPDDTFTTKTHELGDLVVFHNSLEQSMTPPLRVNIGRVLRARPTYKYLIYYPEQDRAKAKKRPKVKRMEKGPSMRALEVQRWRREVLELMADWVESYQVPVF